MRRTIIIGGGTFSHVRNHLSLAAPAFGTVARRIHNGIYHSELKLTKMAENTFLSSQRKADHNNVFTDGMSKVMGNEAGNGQIAYGRRKPSVGSMSQRLVFKQFPDYDCIVHTHNPKREDSDLPTTSQLPFQCGSLECGKNTVNNMKVYDEDIAAVYLDKHGANILFRSDCDPVKVINFINQHLELGVKVS